MDYAYDPEIIREANKYTLPQLYEAFLIEHNARKNLEKSLSQVELTAAGLRAQIRAFKEEIEDLNRYIDEMTDEYLKLHIYKNIFIDTPEDMPEDEEILLKEETINFFFEQPGHKTYFTENGGYVCIYPVPYSDGSVWYYMIEFMWADENNLRQEMTNHYKLIKKIYNELDRPLLYTGIHNVAKNHCTEISPKVWMLTLDDKFNDEIESFREIFNREQSPESDT
jgi:hypothetical protein